MLDHKMSGQPGQASKISLKGPRSARSYLRDSTLFNRGQQASDSPILTEVSGDIPITSEDSEGCQDSWRDSRRTARGQPDG